MSLAGSHAGGTDLVRADDGTEILHRYRSLLGAASRVGRMCYWSLDCADGHYETSDNAPAILGWPEGITRVPEAYFSSRIHPDDLPIVMHRRRNAIRDETPTELDFRFWHAADRRWLFLRSLLFFIRDSAGKPNTLYGFTQDITPQRDAESALSRERQRIESAQILGRMATWRFDVKTRVVHVSSNSLRLLGYEGPSIFAIDDHQSLETFHPEDRIGVLQALSHSCMTLEPIEHEYRRWHHAEKRWVYLKSSAHVVCDADGSPRELQGFTQDITRQKENEERLRVAASVFEHSRSLIVITDIARRAIQVNPAFCERTGYTADEVVGRCPQELILRSDPTDERQRELRFTLLRDGHWTGELACRRKDGEPFTMAVTVSAVRNEQGQIDHFIYVGDDITQQKHAEQQINRLAYFDPLTQLPNRIRIREQIELAIRQAASDGRELALLFLDLDYFKHVNDSLGHFAGDQLLIEVAERLRAADAAMYEAKDTGRNMFFEFVPEMNDTARKRLTLTNELRRALQRNELQLHYQPQVSLVDARIVGAEALLRWKHPEWGMVSPADFIEVAEESGLIEPIGAWVIEEACRQAVAWDALGLPALSMSINCSTRQFLQPHALLETVSAALRNSGLPPARLELEITETQIIKDIAKTQWLLAQCRALGVSIAIDDFGTGYSSLIYLKRLPIDKLKIDQSFVRDLVENPDDRTIASMVAALGHSLGLKVIAEGVETTEQLEILETMHCDEGQGYLWSRPLPPDEFAATFSRLVDRSVSGRSPLLPEAR